MSASSGSLSSRAPGWALVTPALLWTVCFFVLPFVAMARAELHCSMAATAVRSFDNYRQFFANPSYWRAMVNSLEVTLHRHGHLGAACLSLRLDPRRGRAAERCSGWR